MVISVLSLSAGWRLSWDDPNPAGFVASYRVYQYTAIATNILATVTTNTWSIDLPVGEHTVAVTAVGTNGLESDYSAALTFRLIVSPVNIRIQSP